MLPDNAHLFPSMFEIDSSSHPTLLMHTHRWNWGRHSKQALETLKDAASMEEDVPII